jgi:hypothetical protein
MMPHEEVGIGQCITILKIRKKSLIISALSVLVVAILVAGLLPSIYESSSTILIEEQQIPQDFVRSTVTGFADQRIQSLTQQILSRVKLWEIINQFNLYPDLRQKLTREEITEKMRDDIKLETISAEIADKKGGRRPTQTTAVTIAFSIAYRGSADKRPAPWPPFSEQNPRPGRPVHPPQSSTTHQERLKWEMITIKGRHEGFSNTSLTGTQRPRWIQTTGCCYPERRRSQNLYRGSIGHGEA